MTLAERAHPSNGIWLCQSCAKLVDNDPSRYSKNVLFGWKQAAELNALAHLEHGREHPTSLPFKAEEIDLLREAIPEGDLWLFRLMRGTWVRAGSIDFRSENDKSYASLYIDALEGLIRKGLVRRMGRDQFQLTGDGFKIGRRIRESVEC